MFRCIQGKRGEVINLRAPSQDGDRLVWVFNRVRFPEHFTTSNDLEVVVNRDTEGIFVCLKMKDLYDFTTAVCLSVQVVEQEILDHDQGKDCEGELWRVMEHISLT